jgi:hypothetical protein
MSRSLKNRRPSWTWWSRFSPDGQVSITLDGYSHAVLAMQEEEALIAGLVFAGR